jgi:hypothetical protein
MREHIDSVAKSHFEMNKCRCKVCGFPILALQYRAQNGQVGRIDLPEKSFPHNLM